MNKQKSVVYPEVENISLERVSKMIGTYGNKSMSNEFLKDKEMVQLSDKVYEIIQQGCIEKAALIKLEEAVNAYVAWGMNMAYLTGFRDCMEFKMEKIADIG